MAHFNIISSSTGNVLYSGTPRYVGAYLKPGYIEFPEIASPAPIPWAVGDYVVYSRTGMTYRLYTTPKALKQAGSGSYGGAFVYENVQFFADSKRLEYCPFSDTVPYDNQIHFSTLSAFSFYGTPANVAERIQACLETMYGEGTWSVVVASGLDSSFTQELEFSADNLSCLGALDRIYDLWGGLGWSYSVVGGVNTITIGYADVLSGGVPVNGVTDEFSYSDGLVSLGRSVSNADELTTRLFVYGSMKNMDGAYYRSKTIVNAESVDIEHLMIPISHWGTTDGVPDASKAYIQQTAPVSAYGLIPRRAYFDGSDSRYPEVYPSLEGITIAKVRSVKSSLGETDNVPSSVIWSDGTQRVDELTVVPTFTDDGYEAPYGQKYAERSSEITVSFASGTLPIGTGLDIPRQKVAEYTPTITTKGRASFLSGLTGTITLEDDTSAPILTAILYFNDSETSATAPSGGSVLSLTSVSEGVWSFNVPNLAGTYASAEKVMLYIFVEPTGTATTYSLTVSGTAVVGIAHNLDKTFSVTIPQIGFDMNYYADLGEGKTVSMKTGACAARDFRVAECVYDSTSDSWVLSLYRSIDSDLGQWFPNTQYPLTAGDRFVLLDIAMPELYILAQSERLYEYGQALYADISVEKPYYEPQIDAKVVYNESRVLLEGMWMHLVSDEIVDGGEDYALIDTITIDEGESNIPTYDVTLRKRKGLEWTDAAGASTTHSYSSAADSSDMGYLTYLTASQYFLTKSMGLALYETAIGSIEPLAVSIAQNDSRISSLEDWIKSPAMDEAYVGLLNVEDINLAGNPLDWFIPEVVTSSGTTTYRLKLNPKYAGMYAEGWISAGGVSSGSGGGGGGVTLDAVWTSLTENSGDYEGVTINPAHIPSLSYTKISDFATGLSASLRSLTLKVGDATVGTYMPTSASTLTITAAMIRGLIGGDVESLSLAVAENSARITGLEDWLRNPALNTLYVDMLDVCEPINGDLLGNAGTATALETTRSIWGQSFNGTADVTGAMSGVTNINTAVYFAGGLVGINNSNPEYQLDVAGTGRFTGDVTLGSNVYLGTSATASSGFANGQYLEWDDTNKAWHLVGNFYADGFISAGGYSSGSGGGGATLEAVWASLTENSGDYEDVTINPAHIPSLSYTKISDFATGLSASLRSLTLKVGDATVGTYMPTSASTLTITAAMIQDLIGGDIENATEVLALSIAENSARIGSLEDWLRGNEWLAEPYLEINGAYVRPGESFSTAAITAGTAGTASATSGWSFAVPYLTMDAYGIVTAYGTHTHTITPTEIATAIADESARITSLEDWMKSPAFDWLDVNYLNAGDIHAINVSAVGTLGVMGAATLSSTLGVTGAVTLSSTLRVNEATNLYGNLTVGSSSSSKASVFYGTTATTGSVIIGDSSIDTNYRFKVTDGSVYFGSTFTTTGATTLCSAGATTVDLGKGVLTVIGKNNSLLAYKSHVGINNTSPLYPLDVAGKVRITGDALLLSNVYIGSAATAYFAYDSTNDAIYTNVGFYSNGFISAGGLSTSSDARLKTDWKDIDLSVEDIAKTTVGEFTFIKSGERSSGAIAQEWQKLLPNNVRNYQDDYLAMEYGNIALISAVKIAREVVDIESRVKAIEDKLNS